MSIFGIGIDIVQIDRVSSSLDKLGDGFAKKILHSNEFKKYLSLKNRQRYLAKRFAVKEAFAKALGTGIVEGVTLPKIEVVNCNLGKPEIILHGTTLEKANSLDINSIFVSISDERDYAVAQVVLER